MVSRGAFEMLHARAGPRPARCTRASALKFTLQTVAHPAPGLLAALAPIHLHAQQMERNPWWKNVQGPFPDWEGPVGVKEDGGAQLDGRQAACGRGALTATAGAHPAAARPAGGSIRGQGRVGKMLLHRAVCNRDTEGEALPAAGRTHAPAPGACSPYLLLPAARPPELPPALAPAAIRRLVEQGESVNEVEGAGNTPLHNAAYEGWLEGG